MIVTVVRGGTVVRPDRPGRARRRDRRRRIAEIGARGPIDVGRGPASVIDAGGLLVFPGGIDPHVHFDEPGRTEWEGFDAGSAAAAAGGVTTVVDMPIDWDPPTITAAAVAAKADGAPSAGRVDVALWGGLVPGSVGELDALADAGVVGFKAFACPSGWEDFPPVDAATLRGGLGRRPAPGSRWPSTASSRRSATRRIGGRPPSRWAGRLAAETGGRLHVVHVSAAEAVDEARRWPGVTVETCPHYLVLDERGRRARRAARRGALPPIRDAAQPDGCGTAAAPGGSTAWRRTTPPAPAASRAATVGGHHRGGDDAPPAARPVG